MRKDLDRLFTSKTRAKILTVFFRNPSKAFYVRELTRRLKERINSIRRELSNLRKLGLLLTFSKDKKKYYRLNSKFFLFKELKSLVLKAAVMPHEQIAAILKNMGGVKYACLAGIFTQAPGPVDMLIVGNIPRKKLEVFIRDLEKKQEQEINYTVMSEKEFIYRKELQDRFLNSIFASDYITIINEEETDEKQKRKLSTG